MTQTSLKTLYDIDFALWIEETVNQLKSRNIENLDWDNLIEEIESLGKRDKRELESQLTTLFEDALKRCYIPLSSCYRGWEVTINRTQSHLRDILADSPSLSNYLQEIYFNCYLEALNNMQVEYDAEFPSICPFPQDVDILLTGKLWETQE
ncbi:DUF29 domain-containing protein [Planktothrix mougeotii]|uniref:DUF29 domain-containing protein n=1 Tax=Planktothrix mougeotii LEGE 06226 TaxID=1828728 RepID=A0ABR9UH11_9CYAN|nr:DUF29 domain-containing protein [Planktothrix mougeotii]MBE9145755.1 DUF29 domain-containing protein [Planktothrix mougeotii LEGE 06226]